jgi:hypothetical protein
LAASRSWPNATFVGVDLVIGHQIPAQLLEESDDTAGTELPSLKARSSNIGPGIPIHHPFSASPVSPPRGARIRWVQANFLKPLPFGDGEFDYIHISGIARGVPEDKVRCF